MSDPKYGEPVEDPQPVDDVVSSARAGLADAEAASRDVEAPKGVSNEDWDAAYASGSDLPAREPVSPDGVDLPATRRDAASATDGDAATRAPRGSDSDAPTAVVSASEPVATPEPAMPERAAPEPTAPETPAPSPQPIFVQAPEAPQPRGNRGAAGAIGLLAALAFALIYLAAALTFGVLTGDMAVADLGSEALAAVASWWLWVPVVVFFLAFWLLGAILNRGRWGSWVILGLLVGVAAYGGHLLGQLFAAPFWEIAPSQAATLMGEQALAPLAIVAFVAARELTIWFGAWVAARGQRVTELNVEAQREYERTLEAGPQLHRY